MAEAGRKLSLSAWVWVWVAAIAACELAAQPLIRAATPRDESWEAASEYVRTRFQSGDRIVAAPSWADPIVRAYLGDLLSLESAAPATALGSARLWELSIRGAGREGESPAIDESLGEVRVRMWSSSTDEVLYDFVAEIDRAEVELVTDGDSKPCPWTRARPGRGGLGRGPMMPRERFVCDPQRPWLWVAETVLTDLELQPRRCVWQHPSGTDPLRVTFADVPLGERIVIHAGIDYESERARKYAPVSLAVWIGDRIAAEVVHSDGDGWSGTEIDTRELGVERADVRFETTAENPRARRFCWSATSRAGAQHD